MNIKLNYIINFQKATTSIYVFFLMYYYNNYNLTSYIYLSLHGTYGLLWILKDNIFPDMNFHINISSLQASFSIIFLGLYWISPYLIIKNKIEASNFKIIISIISHTIGCVLMMSSDSQKYFVLQEKKKKNIDKNYRLISDGWFKKCRKIQI